jgi:hypothetical protein
MSGKSSIVIVLLLVTSCATLANETIQCGNIPFMSPLRDPLRIADRFDPSGKSGRPHRGIDYACNNADVLAVADGMVRKIGWDQKNVPQPDTRTGKTVRGWGRYVVITHQDGSETLYAHLEEHSTDRLKTGVAVKKGQVIGKSDSTGGVTGPHLHMEFAPNGSVIGTTQKVDPDLCIARSGRIRLSGLLTYHGHFKLYLEDKELGGILPGQKAEFTVEGLFPERDYRLRVESTEPKNSGETGFVLKLEDDWYFWNNAHDGYTGTVDNSTMKKGERQEYRFRVDPFRFR